MKMKARLCACGCKAKLPPHPPGAGRPRRYIDDAHKQVHFWAKKVLKKKS